MIRLRQILIVFGTSTWLKCGAKCGGLSNHFAGQQASFS